MNERIKELRKALGLTQKEFAERISLKRNTIATYEMGRNEPMEPIILSICREFRVNEAWLRDGVGPMFAEATVNEQLTAWIDQILTDEPEGYKVRLVSALSRLDPDGWRALYELAAQFVGAADPSLLPMGGQGASRDGENDVIIDDESEETFEDGSGAGDEDERIEREAEVLRRSYVQTRRGEGHVVGIAWWKWKRRMRFWW